MKTLNTTITSYHFDISEPGDLTAYSNLVEKLDRQGLTCFESWGEGSHYYKESGPVALSTKHLFSNQWNTAEDSEVKPNCRVFDWAQDACLPNKDIKRGHYLTQTPEMRAARDNRHACGYCGKQEPAQKGYVFCPHCMDWQHLERTELYLLRMQATSNTKSRAPLTEAESAHLLPLYASAQAKTVASIKTKRIDSIKANVAKTIKKAEKELEGFLWFEGKGLSTENCIYYAHKDVFTFGWRQPLDEETAFSMHEALTDCPFCYEIKTS